MSTLLADVDVKMEGLRATADQPAYIVTRGMLYADFTLLADADVTVLQQHLGTVVEVGQTYVCSYTGEKLR